MTRETVNSEVYRDFAFPKLLRWKKSNRAPEKKIIKTRFRWVILSLSSKFWIPCIDTGGVSIQLKDRVCSMYCIDIIKPNKICICCNDSVGIFKGLYNYFKNGFDSREKILFQIHATSHIASSISNLRSDAKLWKENKNKQIKILSRV